VRLFYENHICRKLFKQLFAFVLVDYTFGQMDFDLGAGPKYPRVSAVALQNPNNAYDPGLGDQLYIEASLRYQPTTEWQA
jgi:hypothetical protein